MLDSAAIMITKCQGVRCATCGEFIPLFQSYKVPDEQPEETRNEWNWIDPVKAGTCSLGHTNNYERQYAVHVLWPLKK